MRMCAQVCRGRERCCVRMRRCACRHRQARACMRAAACARVRCSVRDGVRARRHTADASKASRQSHLTASPVYESSEGGEESTYYDHMSLEHLCATCRAARVHAHPASDHSSSCGKRCGKLSKLSIASLAVLATLWAVGADEAPPQSLMMKPSTISL